MTLTAGTDQLESFSPATGERLGAVEVTPLQDVAAVVDSVAEVQPFWAQLTLQDRARYLERAAQVLIDEGDEIRDLIVREQGKPRNEAFTMEVLPWGGVKESGLGRTHSKFGLYECVNIKLRVWEASAIKNAWWHPYDETLGKALRQSAKVLYGRPSIRAAALRDGLGPLLTVGARLARDALKR